LQRFEHAADAHATGKVHVLADLSARTHGRPGVDHGAFVHIGADVHIRRHQHGVLGDESAFARDGVRHHAETPSAEIGLGIIGKLAWHLVEILGAATIHHDVVVDAERQQHSLLDPLMRDPVARFLGRDAQAAAVERVDDFIDRVAQFRRHIGRGDVGAVFKSGFNNGLQVAHFQALWLGLKVLVDS